MAGEGVSSSVFHVVYKEGDGELEGGYTGGGGLGALGEGGVLGDFDIAVWASAVRGVSFFEVDEVEIGAIFVGLVDFFQAHGLAGEGASGVGAEDEDGEALRVGEGDSSFAIWGFGSNGRDGGTECRGVVRATFGAEGKDTETEEEDEGFH